MGGEGGFFSGGGEGEEGVLFGDGGLFVVEGRERGPSVGEEGGRGEGRSSWVREGERGWRGGVLSFWEERGSLSFFGEEEGLSLFFLSFFWCGSLFRRERREGGEKGDPLG